jgi:hypothetical protein
MQERDFSNKSPFLKNFSGDPFQHVHEYRTQMRQPIKEAARMKVEQILSNSSQLADKRNLQRLVLNFPIYLS